jgi:hypothetical protein
MITRRGDSLQLCQGWDNPYFTRPRQHTMPVQVLCVV